MSLDSIPENLQTLSATNQSFYENEADNFLTPCQSGGIKKGLNAMGESASIDTIEISSQDYPDPSETSNERINSIIDSDPDQDQENIDPMGKFQKFKSDSKPNCNSINKSINCKISLDFQQKSQNSNFNSNSKNLELASEGSNGLANSAMSKRSIESVEKMLDEHQNFLNKVTQSQNSGFDSEGESEGENELEENLTCELNISSDYKQQLTTIENSGNYELTDLLDKKFSDLDTLRAERDRFSQKYQEMKVLKESAQHDLLKLSNEFKKFKLDVRRESFERMVSQQDELLKKALSPIVSPRDDDNLATGKGGFVKGSPGNDKSVQTSESLLYYWVEEKMANRIECASFDNPDFENFSKASRQNSDLELGFIETGSTLKKLTELSKLETKNSAKSHPLPPGIAKLQLIDEVASNSDAEVMAPRANGDICTPVGDCEVCNVVNVLSSNENDNEQKNKKKNEGKFGDKNKSPLSLKGIGRSGSLKRLRSVFGAIFSGKKE